MVINMVYTLVRAKRFFKKKRFGFCGEISLCVFWKLGCGDWGEVSYIEVMKGKTTYIYGLRRQGKVVYVGKSITPKARFIAHNVSNSTKYEDMIILDKFEDMENYWVKKLLNEGYLLENKETLKYGEDWEVGEVIKILEGYRKGNTKGYGKVSVRHIPTKKEFSSMGEAAEAFGICSSAIYNNIHSRNPNRVKWEYIK
jgi:hypothetical protein